MKATVSLILTGLALILQEGFATDIKEEVFNGYNARPGQFPYQAFLRSSKSGSNLQWLCGGSLISSQHVLTAAHCLEGIDSSIVTLGITDQNNQQGTYSVRVTSSQMTIHPDYNDSRFNNDLAIIRLPQAVSNTNLISPIRLASRNWANPSTFDNYYATVSGFGLTRNEEPSPYRILQYRTVLVMPHNQCAAYTNNNPTLTRGMICTDRRVNAGHCQGDSGGPLAVSLNTGNFLIGVVSWGYRPCVNSGPSVYANVANYIDWISQVTGIQFN